MAAHHLLMEVENKYIVFLCFGVQPLLVLYQTAFILTNKGFFPSRFLPALLRTGVMEQLWWALVQSGAPPSGAAASEKFVFSFMLGL